MSKTKYIIVALLLLSGCSSVEKDTSEEHHLLHVSDYLAYKSITKEDYFPPKEFN
ncbi:MAG: hypothetical protein H8E05_01340 [Bacteroidetes bacterium]|nr:hypothetical protein [Bacteroidota bacterium]